MQGGEKGEKEKKPVSKRPNRGNPRSGKAHNPKPRPKLTDCSESMSQAHALSFHAKRGKGGKGSGQHSTARATGGKPKKKLLRPPGRV